MHRSPRPAVLPDDARPVPSHLGSHAPGFVPPDIGRSATRPPGEAKRGRRAGWSWPRGSRPTTWESRHRATVAVADTIATTAAVWVGYLVLPPGAAGVGHREWFAAATWGVICAALTSCWDHRVLGQGAEEFRRLGRAMVVAAVLLALAGLAVGAVDVRPWVFAVVPAATVLCACGRYALRKVLHRRRAAGRCLLPVIAAGDLATLADLIDRCRREAHVGWDVQAVCVPRTLGGDAGRRPSEIDSVPVVGHLEDLVDRVRSGGYRVVAVGADRYWTRQRLQRLAWELEGTSAEMVVAPVLMDVAGPRVHVSEVLGMPLLRVSAPSFTVSRLLVKSVVDRLGALVMLAVLAPVLLGIAVAVKVEGSGPVLYRQRRVGRGGAEFTMLKFRTMVEGADTLRPTLAARDVGAGPMFKSRTDPRLTRIGALLRGFSLDELPQLVNVLTGRMSLVGPRPPLPEEMASYAPEVFRKFRVTPGMTGLWQVSGRSDLSWAETVRLDLRYVENWSLALDMTILWKTLRAVVTRRGAY